MENKNDKHIEGKKEREEAHRLVLGMERIMDKDRMAAFLDAIWAVIMTILVLELEKPATMSWSALWELRESFFAYILSFGWLGFTWLDLHYDWQYVKKITRKTGFATLNLLLWTSFMPYATAIMAKNFQNTSAQIFYGIVVVIITLSTEYLYRTLDFQEAESKHMKTYRIYRDRMLARDIISKLISLLISIFLYPPFMSYGIIFGLLFFNIPNLLREGKK